MSLSAKFIGTTSSGDILKTCGTAPWESVTLSYIPYSVVRPPNEYIFTLGSANNSCATISAFGIIYTSGIHVFRRDLDHPAQIDWNHYVAQPISELSSYAVFMSPKAEPHHLTPYDQVFPEIPVEWKGFVRNTLIGQYPL